MVQEAIKLKNDYRGVKVMVSVVQICINQEGEPLEGAKYETVKGRPSRQYRIMAIGTVIGVDQKEYSRAKLKLIGNRFQEEIIHKMSAIV